MALNFPYPAVINDTYTDPNGRLWVYDGVKWNVDNGTANRTFSGAKVSLTALTALTATATALDFDEEEFDTENYYAFTTANRFTVPKTGYYRIDGTFYTSANGSGNSYTFSLKKNGSVTLTTQTSAPNESANYDSTIELEAGDYLEVYCSESTATGALLSGSYMEITLIGRTPGVSLTPGDTFSGVKTVLTSAVSTTANLTAIAWDTTEYNINADVQGNLYWSANSSSNLTVKTTGYYQIKSYIAAGSAGADNSYYIQLKKNNNMFLSNVVLGPNDYAYLDELYQLSANDYVQLYANNAGATGTLLTSTNLEIIRLGI